MINGKRNNHKKNCFESIASINPNVPGSMMGKRRHWGMYTCKKLPENSRSSKIETFDIWNF